MGYQVQFREFVNNNVKCTSKNLWIRSMGLDDSGVIFVPASLYRPGESSAKLCAIFDGVDIVEYLGHLYVPIDWLEQNVKNDAAVLKVLKHMRHSMKSIKFEKPVR